MANDMKLIKIPITLDRERNLVIDLNTFADLEETYGDHNKALEALSSGSFKAIRKFLWLGLVHEDESLTEREAGSLVIPENMDKIAEVILSAIPKKK